MTATTTMPVANPNYVLLTLAAEAVEVGVYDADTFIDVFSVVKVVGGWKFWGQRHDRPVYASAEEAAAVEFASRFGLILGPGDYLLIESRYRERS